ISDLVLDLIPVFFNPIPVHFYSSSMVAKEKSAPARLFRGQIVAPRMRVRFAAAAAKAVAGLSCRETLE
ncbi:hypothetical protein, partial [Nitrobacter sp. 62-23]|uniref:hypothetical protein n=1 Tax=Nitrobacter sp. 62-23 TaxID=1895798 RepID=UPI0025DB1E96